MWGPKFSFPPVIGLILIRETKFFARNKLLITRHSPFIDIITKKNIHWYINKIKPHLVNGLQLWLCLWLISPELAVNLFIIMKPPQCLRMGNIISSNIIFVPTWINIKSWYKKYFNDDVLYVANHRQSENSKRNAKFVLMTIW